MTKTFVSEAFGRIADRAVQMHGAAGIAMDLPISRIYQDARAQDVAGERLAIGAQCLLILCAASVVIVNRLRQQTTRCLLQLLEVERNGHQVRSSEHCAMSTFTR